MSAVLQWPVRDDVRPLGLDAYHRALDGLVAALQVHPGVVSVYQLGSVRFPGISDLDVIIVVNDDIPVGTDFRRIVRASAGPDASYIFSHAPYVIHEDGFPDLRALFYADNLQLRWGRALSLAVRPDDEQAFYAYQIAVESAIGQSFAFLRSLDNRSAANLRSLLCHLNAVRHNFGTMARWSGGDERPEWREYLERVDRLRGTWFQQQTAARHREAWELMAAARAILLGILGELAGTGMRLGYLRPGSRRAWLSLLEMNILLEFSPGVVAGARQLANPLRFLRRVPALGHWVSLQPRWRELSSDVSVLTLPSAIRPLVDGWDPAPGRVSAIMAERRIGARGPADDELPESVRGWMVRKRERLDGYLGFLSRKALTGLLLVTPAFWLQKPASLQNRLKTRWNGLWAARGLGGA